MTPSTFKGHLLPLSVATTESFMKLMEAVNGICYIKETGAGDVAVGPESSGSCSRVWLNLKTKASRLILYS